jgi:DNA adenine methylase
MPNLLPFFAGHQIRRAKPRPFVKWAGGKSQILPELRENFPQGLGERYTKFVEPFVGGGAVLLDVISSFKFESVHVFDTNFELITAWRVIRDEVCFLIDRLDELKSRHMELVATARDRHYYAMRERFNHLKTEVHHPDPVELAALLIYLNRTCYNGLYRVNSRGIFNVPVGIYANPKISDPKNLKTLSLALKGVNIEHGDYSRSEPIIDEKSFVYFDPPYRPLTPTSNFTTYTQNGFGDDQQRALAAFFAKISNKGAAAMLSNSDPKGASKDSSKGASRGAAKFNPEGASRRASQRALQDDDFFDELYKDFNILRVQARRLVSRDKSGRGLVTEILVKNY